MSGHDFDIRIDTDGTLERVRRQLAELPEGISRAQRRALKKLSTWLQRQVLKEASAATGATQKTLKALVRYRVTQRDSTLSIWLGTNPIKLHHLGAVTWRRAMQGARVGRRSYPGTWSWPSGRTGGLVMQRLSDTRLPIEPVSVPVHEAVIARLEALQPQVETRYRTLLEQELNYVLNVERRAA